MNTRKNISAELKEFPKVNSRDAKTNIKNKFWMEEGSDLPILLMALFQKQGK